MVKKADAIRQVESLPTLTVLSNPVASCMTRSSIRFLRSKTVETRAVWLAKSLQVDRDSNKVLSMPKLSTADFAHALTLVSCTKVRSDTGRYAG